MIVETERDTTLYRLYAALVDVAISVGRAPIAIRNSRLYAPMLTYTIFESYSIIYHIAPARLLGEILIRRLCPTIDILPLMTNADGQMSEKLLPFVPIHKGPNGNHAVSSHNKLISQEFFKSVAKRATPCFTAERTQVSMINLMPVLRFAKELDDDFHLRSREHPSLLFVAYYLHRLPHTARVVHLAAEEAQGCVVVVVGVV